MELKSLEGKMRAIRRIKTVGEKGKLVIEIPEEFGSKVEVIILPVQPEAEEYSNWTDEEWQGFGLQSFMNTEDDRNVDWEDFFSVKTR